MEFHSAVCPNCGAKLHFDDEEQEFCFCSHCGTQVFKSDANKQTVKINKNVTYRKIDDAKVKAQEIKRDIRFRELEHEEKSDRSFSVLMIVMLLFAVGLMFGPTIVFHISDNNKAKIAEEYRSQGMISAGNASDYLGKRYDAVVAQLDAAGFTNIETIDLDDAGIFSLNKKDSVDSVSIAGNSGFSSDDFFNPDDKVIITYH